MTRRFQCHHRQLVDEHGAKRVGTFSLVEIEAETFEEAQAIAARVHLRDAGPLEVMGYQDDEDDLPEKATRPSAAANLRHADDVLSRAGAKRRR